MMSFVAPAPILKNPQICAGRGLVNRQAIQSKCLPRRSGLPRKNAAWESQESAGSPRLAVLLGQLFGDLARIAR